MNSLGLSKIGRRRRLLGRLFGTRLRVRLPGMKRAHSLRITESGVILSLGGNVSTAPYLRTTIREALCQDGSDVLPPVVYCKFELQRSSLTVMVNLPAEMLHANIGDLVTVMVFRGNKDGVSRQVFAS